MSHRPIFGASRHRPDPVARTLGGGALAVSLVALLFAMSGVSSAGDHGGNGAVAHTAAKKKKKKSAGACARGLRLQRLVALSTKRRPCGLLRLDRKGKFPAAAIPLVGEARRARTLGGARRDDLVANCPIADAVDLGTWCLQNATFPVPPEEAGRNDYLYAARTCVELGGWLPSAAQLLGAADRLKLASTVDDNATTASVDEDPTDGLKDQREMSGDLFTVAAGASAAGSQGVSAGSRGDPRQGEPNPVPLPADPLPDTLNYVTIYDNRNHGGFAGGKSVGSTERFRCAFAKGYQGDPVAD